MCDEGVPSAANTSCRAPPSLTFAKSSAVGGAGAEGITAPSTLCSSAAKTGFVGTRTATDVDDRAARARRVAPFVDGTASSGAGAAFGTAVALAFGAGALLTFFAPAASASTSAALLNVL